MTWMLIVSLIIIGLWDVKSLLIAAGFLVLTLILHKHAKTTYVYALYITAWIAALVYVRMAPVHVLGLLFLMLRAISYMGDMHYEKYELGDIKGIAIYFFFLPSYVMGPVMRYDKFMKVCSERKISYDSISEGVLRIISGLFKKLVIADRLMIAIRIWTDGDSSMIIALLLYSVALWADFSGGCDIAIGAAKCLGISLSENFNKPYMARNLGQFWRCWHITMADFFRDYVFYPLTVSGFMRKLTKGNIRVMTSIATVVCFAITGLWHGFTAGFLVWGLLNGLIIALEGRRKPWRYGYIYTYIVVSFLRIFDLCDTSVVGTKIRLMFCFTASMVSGDIVRHVITGLVMLILWAILMRVKDKICYKGIVGVVMLLMIAVFGVYGYDFVIDGFVYGNY